MTKLDNKCPACGMSSDLDEVFEGEQYNCRECDAYLVATLSHDGVMRLECAEDADDGTTDDQAPLCDASVHYREDDGTDVIPW